MRADSRTGLVTIPAILRAVARIEREQGDLHLSLVPVQGGAKLPPWTVHADFIHQRKADLGRFGQHTATWRNMECHPRRHLAFRKTTRTVALFGCRAADTFCSVRL